MEVYYHATTYHPSSPSMDTIAPACSKKRQRSIEPVDAAKIIGLPPLVAVRGLQNSLDSVINTTDVGAFSPRLTTHTEEESIDNTTTATETEQEENDDEDATVRRSLMGLALQLKLKTMLVEAWASDMNSVVIERNLFAIAKELAILKHMGVYEEDTCVKFVQLARQRMETLLNDMERGEKIHMDTTQMWTMAQIQAQESIYVQANSPRESLDSEFPLLSGYDASSRDISVLWKAMSIARDRGAQLWHENKPEQALPFLVAADSYMKRFTLKYQRLKVDHAVVDACALRPASLTPTLTSTTSASVSTKRVSFAAEPQVLGVADAEVDRSPINPTKPSRLESLLLRTSREFPTPAF